MRTIDRLVVAAKCREKIPIQARTSAKMFEQIKIEKKEKVTQLSRGSKEKGRQSFPRRKKKEQIHSSDCKFLAQHVI